MNNAMRMAIAAAAVIAVALIGSQLLSGPGVGGPTASQEPSFTPTQVPTAPRAPSGDVGLLQAQWDAAAQAGFWGLPPEGARPSTPERGELVETYLVHGGGLPFEGSVRLYADGRLIWYMFDVGPVGSPLTHEPTGYVEQRLTPQGIELVRAHDNLAEKDPMRLSDWLPATAWQDQRIRAYVPSAYAACIYDDASRGPYPAPGPPIDRSTLSMLPATAERLLSDRESVPPLDDAWDCLALTVDDARELNRILGDAGFEVHEGMVLEYQLDASDLGTTVTIQFEPLFPDGTINCSTCG